MRGTMASAGIIIASLALAAIVFYLVNWQFGTAAALGAGLTVGFIGAVRGLVS